MEAKPAVIIGGVMAFITLVSLGVLFVVMKPGHVKEAEKTGVQNFQFPGGGASRPAGAAAAVPMALPMDSAAPAGARSAGSSERSSLGFIQKDSSMGGMDKEEAARAAEQAEAKAKAKAPAGEAEKPGRLSDDAVREIMQRIVDLVHKHKKGWYSEFLAKAELKAIADRYNESNDFKAFLRELAKSAGFNGMLKKRRGTPAMKGLVKTLLKDPQLKQRISEMFIAFATDPSARTLLRKHGKSSGVPDSLMAMADGQDQLAAGEDPSHGKLGQRKIKKMDFSRTGFGSRGGGDTPSGVNPEQLKSLLQR